MTEKASFLNLVNKKIVELQEEQRKEEVKLRKKKVEKRDRWLSKCESLKQLLIRVGFNGEMITYKYDEFIANPIPYAEFEVLDVRGYLKLVDGSCALYVRGDFVDTYLLEKIDEVKFASELVEHIAKHQIKYQAENTAQPQPF